MSDADKVRIHNHLVVQVAAATFYRVAYAPQTGLMVSEHTEENSVRPASFQTNEVAALFGDAENRRELRRAKVSSTWQMILDFQDEVDTGLFEEQMETTGASIAPSTAGDTLIQVQISEATYSHPPRQNADRGTRVTYTFTVLPMRP